MIFLGIKYEPLSDPPVIKICEWGPWEIYGKAFSAYDGIVQRVVLDKKKCLKCSNLTNKAYTYKFVYEKRNFQS